MFLGALTGGKLNLAPNGSAFFIVASTDFTAGVNASSSSGQEPKNRFKEGLFPYSPYAHTTAGPHFGLVPGQRYTLRWAAHPRLNNNVCAGDNQQAMLDLNDAGGGSERGYIEETSASVIRQAIEGDYQTVWRGIGDSVIMTGGAKSAELDAVINRVHQDSNSYAPSYTSYASDGNGNGRRIVGAPINTGYPNYTVVQIGAFFLLREQDYIKGGNEPLCAEYLGPWVQGANHKGAGEAGAYVTRLIQ
jgi:hypothetical protein